MKYRLFYLFVFFEILAYSQDYVTLHNRYWYYRTRLRNDFMKVGLSNGCSIPMGQRGLGYEPYGTTPNYFFTDDPSSGSTTKWGDAMGELGYYIGVLATEYNLLSRNNQETDSVRYELYCALQALNRMDYYAEPYFTQAIANSTNPQTFGASFNGFMLRDDVPINFVQNNMKSFNYFGNRGFCSKVKVNSISTTSGNGAQMQGETDGEKNYAGSYISQDNWINCIVGLALVRKFIPSGVNYKNMSFMDGNGPDISQEAFSIALRVMNYFKQDASWLIKYPAGNYIGSDWGGIGTGLAFAHAEALNKIDQKKWGHYVQPDPLSFNNWCEYNDWRHDGNWLTQLYKNTVAIPFMYTNYLSSSHASGSLGNLYTQLPLIVNPNGESVYKANLYFDSSNPDVAVQTSNLSAVCNCEYTFRGVDTKSRLQMHINHHQIWHPELIRVVLHGEGSCHTTQLNTSYYNAAISLISSAPCEGPYNWEPKDGGTPYGPVLPSGSQWHTQTQLDHPESRLENGWIAEFNGIDYMLYHNLVTIIDAEKYGMNNTKQMVDLGRRHITTPYPWTISGTTWGTTTKPAVVKAYEYITANNTVGTPYFLFTNVSYLAGKEITLGDGFSATNQGYFTAAIQQFECSEILSNPLDPSVNARIATTNQNNNEETIYPDLLLTSYTDNIYVEELALDESNNNVTYNPALVSSDSLKGTSSSILDKKLVAELAPNPSTGLTKLFLSKPELVKSIEVLDPLGKLLFTISSISFSNDIEFGGISKGIYSITIRGVDNDVLVKKIVIQ